MRFRAVVEYDGTSYHGFQRQRETPTVQGELERAIEAVGGQSVAIVGAGRTDSGVHALGQVIAFDLEWRHDPSALQRALNASLPADIVVAKVAETDRNFHPRYSAKRREYAYHIYNSEVRSPLRRRTSWHVSRSLHLEKLNRVAAALVGVKDFATFGQPPKGQNTVRQVFRAGWKRQDEILIFEIEANAFLYRMVRSLVGSMKAVGEGVWTLEEFVDALEARDRSRAGQTAPPHALFLVAVTYD